MTLCRVEIKSPDRIRLCFKCSIKHLLCPRLNHTLFKINYSFLIALYKQKMTC